MQHGVDPLTARFDAPSLAVALRRRDVESVRTLLSTPINVEAIETILSVAKTDAMLAVLCSAGGIHAVLNALKASTGNEALLKGTVLTLRHLYKFDAKLTSIVVRLQDGISAILENLRERIHCVDTELLQALLTILGDVSHNAANVQVIVKENGTAVILAAILAHLKNDQMVLPALNVLVAISRHPSHIATLVREGGVPAVLAAILAHLRRVEVLRAALTVLRSIVSDEHSAVRLGGQGAYRIVFAVLQTHASVEQLDLIRLGAGVLWRMHHARSPPTQLLHSHLGFTKPGTGVADAGGDARAGAGRGLFGVDVAGADEGEAGEGAADELDDEAGDSDCGEDLGASFSAGAAELAKGGDEGCGSAGAPAPAPAAEEATPALAVPQALMRYGGHADWMDSCPAFAEELSASAVPQTHAELIVKSITSEAERLLASYAHRTPAGGGAAAVAAAAAAAAAAAQPPSEPTYPRVVYEAFPLETPAGGAQAGAPAAAAGPSSIGASSGAGGGAGGPPSLGFDAGFESANLRRAVQVGPKEYHLVLNCDVNTRGHTQWFLFRVRGMLPGVPYRFHIINMMKPDSLFSSGMRPLLYSEAAAAAEGIGWRRCGDDIAYFMNQYSYAVTRKPPPARKGGGRGRGVASQSGGGGGGEPALAYFYSLTFSITFPHADDVCYVAQCYPFTYSMQQARTSALVGARGADRIVRRETLCTSYGGNTVDLLSVTDFTSPPDVVAARKVVVVSARVHPGESNASWMMAGLLEAVTADTEPARRLRRMLMLKIVPMLNPDGVVLGNYRCSAVGVDLNRQWQDPHEVKMPSIFALKRLMRGIVATEQLLLYCDLHGHSRKRNVFAYGCEITKGPNRLRERVFPRLLAECPHFSFPGCSYKVLRSKDTTGRVVVSRQFATPNSFTIEASFCGADFGRGAGAHYSIAHLKEMGAAFVPALLDFADPSQAHVNAILAELEAQFPSAEDDADEADEADEDGAPARKGGGAHLDSLADASEKLRRAARVKSRAAAAAKAVKAGKEGGDKAATKATKATKAVEKEKKK